MRYKNDGFREKIVEKSEKFVIIREVKEVDRMFNVWENVLAEIEQTVERSVFLTWFNDVNLVSFENGVAEIGVKNVFYKNQLEKTYKKQIEKAMQNNGMDFREIVFIVQADHKPKVRAREVSRSEIQQLNSERKTVERAVIQTSSHDNNETGLNERYTMDNFVVGSNNDLAVAIARNVIEQPGKKYNPFFLYGGPGLGKTHLVQAIGNELHRRNPKMKILFAPMNHFYSDFISSIHDKKGDEFRMKFRKLDVLIIDDFQQIIGKDASQEEFFNIFNDLYNLDKQIIVTSDRLPSQIQELDERLASRLTWAGAIDLQMPKFEDKCAILRSKADFMGAEIEDEAIEYIAENIKTNIRDLEGELSQLIALSEIRGISPLELINDGYVNPRHNNHKTASAKVIVEKVAKYFDLTPKDICGKSRVANINQARQIVMYLLSEELNMSTPKIGMEVGGKDHSTVMHGIDKIKNNLKINFLLRDQIEEIRAKIYG